MAASGINNNAANDQCMGMGTLSILRNLNGRLNFIVKTTLERPHDARRGDAQRDRDDAVQ